MGVLDSIGMVEALGLALLAVALFLVTRRRNSGPRDGSHEAGTIGMMGAAAMMQDRHDPPSDFGGGYGGGDAGGI